MGATFQKTFGNGFFWTQICEFRLGFVSLGPIGNKPALVKVMAWRRIGEKNIISTNAKPFHRRIYAALMENELKKYSDNGGAAYFLGGIKQHLCMIHDVEDGWSFLM